MLVHVSAKTLNNYTCCITFTQTPGKKIAKEFIGVRKQELLWFVLIINIEHVHTLFSIGKLIRNELSLTAAKGSLVHVVNY